MNYYGTTISNKFKTKNDNEVADKLESYGFEVWKDEDGIEFGSEDAMWSNEMDEDNFDEYLQSMLLDGQHVFLKETGNEGLRYNTGWALFINKKIIKGYNLDNFEEEMLNVKV